MLKSLWAGVLTAWAWGFSRILDGIILTAPEFDRNRVGVIGCSRDGKSALAAGIFDDRVSFSAVIDPAMPMLNHFRRSTLSCPCLVVRKVLHLGASNSKNVRLL